MFTWQSLNYYERVFDETPFTSTCCYFGNRSNSPGLKFQKKKKLQNEICFLEFRPKDHLDISFDINERSELLHNIFLSFSNKKNI